MAEDAQADVREVLLTDRRALAPDPQAAAIQYKPQNSVYHYVMQDLDMAPGDCCMVAPHVWDTIGGMAAGMAGGLVTRPGNALLPVQGLPQPNAVGATLPDLARDMIRQWR